MEYGSGRKHRKRNLYCNYAHNMCFNDYFCVSFPENPDINSGTFKCSYNRTGYDAYNRYNKLEKGLVE